MKVCSFIKEFYVAFKCMLLLPFYVSYFSISYTHFCCVMVIQCIEVQYVMQQFCVTLFDCIKMALIQHQDFSTYDSIF